MWNIIRGSYQNVYSDLTVLGEGPRVYISRKHSNDAETTGSKTITPWRFAFSYVTLELRALDM